MSGTSIDRRANVAVAEIYFRFFHNSVVGFDRLIRAVDCCAIGFNSSIRRIGSGCQLLILLTRNNSRLNQLRIAFDLQCIPLRYCQIPVKIRFDLFLHRDIFRHSRLRLAHCRLKGTRIDGEEHVAFPHVRAIREMDLDDSSRDLRLNCHRFARDGFSDGIEIDGNVLHGCFGDSHRRRGAFETRRRGFVRTTRKY